jgi:aspartate/glutamate racemase
VQGAEMVISGCTELSMVLGNGDYYFGIENLPSLIYWMNR